MSNDEVLQLAARKRLLVPRDIDILLQQLQRLGVARYPAQITILDAAHERSERRPRKAQCQDVARRMVRVAAGLRAGHERGFAVAEKDLLPALGDEIRTAQVDHQRKVVDAVGGERPRPLVARAVESAREQLKAGQLLQRDVDLERDIAQRLGVDPEHRMSEELSIDGRPLPLGCVGEREADWLRPGWLRAEQHFARARSKMTEIAHGPLLALTASSLVGAFSLGFGGTL